MLSQRDPDRELWLAVRRACLLVAAAIARRYDVDDASDGVPCPAGSRPRAGPTEPPRVRPLPSPRRSSMPEAAPRRPPPSDDELEFRLADPEGA